jgi:hypothetical protein
LRQKPRSCDQSFGLWFLGQSLNLFPELFEAISVGVNPALKVNPKLIPRKIDSKWMGDKAFYRLVLVNVKLKIAKFACE